MTWPGVVLGRYSHTYLPSATMRSVAGSSNRTESLPGRCCWYSPELFSVLPVSELTMVWSKVARAVFTRDHAATARLSGSDFDDCAEAGAAALDASTLASASVRNGFPVIVLREKGSWGGTPRPCYPRAAVVVPGAGASERPMASAMMRVSRTSCANCSG